ncbi:hypothetical protein EON67_07795 [archaeon]|nr:MAG: hypothetical protein EON67_07795 [archaeon]
MKSAAGVVESVQKGVLRTNCMDNLDRTNVVQSLFARQAALAAVPSALERARREGCSVLTSPYASFEHAFNNLWANNADSVSMLYSGTGALKTDFTRTGKRTYMGSVNDGVNSVMRYVLNNLVDGRRQDAWDLFLARYVPRRTASASPTDVGVAAVGNKVVDASALLKQASPIRRHLHGITPVCTACLGCQCSACTTLPRDETIRAQHCCARVKCRLPSCCAPRCCSRVWLLWRSWASHPAPHP